MIDYPKPRKRLGQHFLTDRNALVRIVEALEVSPQDVVVEIGPGRGALTELLAQRAKRVVAIELDEILAAKLRERWANVEVVVHDVLDVRLAEAAGQDDYVLAGNVPYYITTPILFHAMTPPMPNRAVFLVQREVAERAVAPPGSKTYGALSVNLQAITTPTLVGLVSARAFTPPPKVESAILKVEPRAVPLVARDVQQEFSRFVIEVFSYRRKQMRRIVRTLGRLEPASAEAVLGRVGIEPEARPETLEPERFVALFQSLR